MSTLLNDDVFSKIIQTIKENNENYISTIKAAQSFISVITFDNTIKEIDGNAKFAIGRTMDTSSKNKIIPNNFVTPDIVIQNDVNGYVVEIKKTLPSDTTCWGGVVDQLLKYDDDLTGWWKENFSESNRNEICVICLIHQSRANQFRTFLQDYIKEKGYKFDHCFSIVSFNRSDEVKQFYFLEMKQGEIVPEKIQKQLSIGTQVPIEKVIATYKQLKFFDSEPLNIEYIMGVLWQDIFMSLPRGKYNTEMKGFEVKVEIDKVTEELQKSYGHEHNDGNRNVEFPQKSWIERALNSFISIKLAKKETDNSYTVFVKPIQSDIIEYFARRLHKKEIPTLTQLSLFNQKG